VDALRRQSPRAAQVLWRAEPESNDPERRPPFHLAEGLCAAVTFAPAGTPVTGVPAALPGPANGVQVVTGCPHCDEPDGVA
jgi:hypothetical protein